MIQQTLKRELLPAVFLTIRHHLSERKSINQGNNTSYHEGRVPQAEG
jgi:hypothetical protein